MNFAHNLTERATGLDGATLYRLLAEPSRPYAGRAVALAVPGAAWLQLTFPTGPGLSDGGLYALQCDPTGAAPMPGPVLVWYGGNNPPDAAQAARAFKLRQGETIWLRAGPDDHGRKVWVIPFDVVTVGTCEVGLVPFTKDAGV